MYFPFLHFPGSHLVWFVVLSCCMGATVKFHLQKEGTSLASHILHNIYVDNVLIGANCVSDTHGIYEGELP